MIAEIRGEGPPLIVIHGFGVDHRIMLPLEDMLGEQNWQRVYLDLPWAAAAEDTGVASPQELADSVLEEVSQILGGRSFAVIGNSFGAMVARHVAHTLSEQCVGLATLAGAFQMDRTQRVLPQHQATQYDEKVLELAGEAREEFAEMAVIHTAANLEAFERFVLPGIRESKQEVLDRIGERYSTAYTPEIAAAGTFMAPSLHVFGRQDQVVGFEDGTSFRNHHVRGTFTVLDAAGHNLHLEQPEIVSALIREWLHRVSVFYA
ncbi:alpha/beta fold hydrolase [Leucobacter sp. gxy201]|uniref:alpha/beta fold hydrolase n=1 Tax=Leucobacter sp. gxy201 TaxID=2957200 RepID=UPI003DA128C3